MGKNKPSIVYYEDRCAACGATQGLERHHCLHGTANRKLADKDGLTVMLCYTHHRASGTGVHGGNTELDNELKAVAQKAYMESHGVSVNEWISRYGKNYL